MTTSVHSEGDEYQGQANLASGFFSEDLLASNPAIIVNEINPAFEYLQTGPKDY